jgi:hypothetical protein
MNAEIELNSFIFLAPHYPHYTYHKGKRTYL